jgi:NAD+ diphosphatase
MPSGFQAHMRPKDDFPGQPIYLCVRGGELLVAPGGPGAELPAEPPATGIEHVLGSIGDRACVAVDLNDIPLAGSLRRVGLRELHGLVTEEIWGLASRAVQVVMWDRQHRFCGRCGTPTNRQTNERARRCPSCGLSAYPRLTPAVIVLVTRGAGEERALLAWGRRRATPFYSLVAGFVEPGEDLEAAVAREVLEETAIELTEIRYCGSQPWPFPSQLMVGFRARYAGGEIKVQESEIVEARWFSAEEAKRAATSRGGFSIAGQLLDGWLAEQRGN